MRRILTYSAIFCLIIFTSSVNSRELYNGVINAKQIWFLSGMGMLVLLAGKDILGVKKSIFLKLSMIDLAIILFYVYYLIRTATTPYIAILSNQRFLNWSLLTIMYFIIQRVKTPPEDSKDIRIAGLNLSRFNYLSLIVFLLILSALCQAIWGLLQLYGYLPSFNSNFKITGAFFNPAPYAIYLAVIFPAALGQIIFYKEALKFKKIKRSGELASPLKYLLSWFICNVSLFNYCISMVTVIAVILVLPATMIRAAWLAALVGAAVVFGFKYHFPSIFKQFLNTRLKKIVFWSLSLLLVFMLSIFLHYLKKDSSFGKLLIWEVTVEKIAEKPFFGNGVGRFEPEYNNWQAGYFQNHPKEMNGLKGLTAGNTKYAFNEFLEITAETGIIGLILFMLLIGIVFYFLIKSNSLAQRLILSIFISFVTSLIISSPFYSLPNTIVFFICISLADSSVFMLNTEIKLFNLNSFKKNGCTGIRYLITAVFVFISLTLFMLACKQYQTYSKWKNAASLYNINKYREACQLFSGLFPNMECNGIFLQYYGKSLYYTHNPDSIVKSIEILENAKNFTSDEVLYTTLGDCYKAIRQFEHAEAAYLRAVYMVPNKLYPKFLLVKLYAESEQPEKAKKLAWQIIHFVPKINSTTTDELKEEAKKIYTKITIN